MKIKSHAILVLLILTIISTNSWSQALFSETVRFKLSESCQASDSIKNPKKIIQLHEGESYISFGENKLSNATHTFIEVNDQKKWIDINCGDYETSKPEFKKQSTGNNHESTHPQSESECLNFFDDIDNPIAVLGGNKDITPKAPVLDEFDIAVNSVCGKPGKKTTRQEFIELMNSNQSVISQLFKFTNGKVFSNRPASKTEQAFLGELAEAWYEIAAFDHIFCGERKDNSSIGGLHFHGRYQQLEKDGTACRQPQEGEKTNEVIEGSIYTMGVKMRINDNDWISHDTKGYGLTLSARDILMAATRAFSENGTNSKESTACILNLIDDSVTYPIVFVRRNNGIRTFFPDATPNKNEKKCHAAITLPQ